MKRVRVIRSRRQRNGSIEVTYYQGVYSREHAARLFDGSPDVCYDIAYRHNGKLVWEKVGWLSEGYSPALAEGLRADRIRAIRHGDELPKERKRHEAEAAKGIPTFQEAAKEYLKWAETNHTRKGCDDESRYKLHLAARFDKKHMNEITVLDIEKMKTELLKAGSAPATVAHALKLVRQIFNKSIAWGLYEGLNPVRGVKMPIVVNHRERFLSFEEARLLLDELKKRSAIVHDMALLSLSTGMRAGEIFALRGHDIDVANGIVNIANPKNGESRKAYVTGDALVMLQHRVSVDTSTLVFPGRGGIQTSIISDTFSRTADELFNRGVADRRQRVTFHSLRHTFASWLAIQGESPFVIQRLMGHKSLSMTERYSHLSPSQSKNAVATLEKAFKEGKDKGDNIV